jgi:UDP-glucose 4-epimerase
MNILVTGSAGFIASHLIEELLSDSSNMIIGIDNFYSGTKENINYLKSCDKNQRFKFVESDIRDFGHIQEIISKYKIEQIYHLAAIVSVQESIQNPLLSNEVNVKGTLNILEVSRLNNVKRVVFSSSAAVYGDEPTLPKDENSFIKSISSYGVEKFMSEEYMKLYSSLYDIETVILRYFNVYGPRQSDTNDYSGVISIFEKKFKNNEIPNIYGDGRQYRDFIYVNDLVDMLNIKYAKDIKSIYLEIRTGDIKESISNNSKIKEKLKINNFIDFKEGILNL